jgi:hypothetical protein
MSAESQALSTPDLPEAPAEAPPSIEAPSSSGSEPLTPHELTQLGRDDDEWGVRTGRWTFQITMAGAVVFIAATWLIMH